jgi:hypothetical protein
MLNQNYSKTNFLKKEINIGFDVDKFNSMSFKKDELYYTNDGDLELNKTVLIQSKNIFSVYTKDVYEVYEYISKYLKEICIMYEIDIKKQKYMIYGKLSKYGPKTNKIWYDFPGIGIPHLHGMCFITGESYELSFSNSGIIKKETFSKNELFINKPTDLINIKTEQENDVIEFYIAPLYALKHNEPGVWVPII